MTDGSARPTRRRARGALSSKLLAVIRDHLGMRVHGIARRVSLPIYARGASVRACDGRCCRHGTVASLEERDRILANARNLAKHMTSRERDRPARWFEGPVERNPDYACGKSVTTRVVDGACVFLRTDKLCALQVGSERAGEAAFAWKPAMCLLWPLCVSEGKLDVGHAWYTRRKACCAPVRAGARTVGEVIGPDDGALLALARRENSRGGARGKR